MRARHLAPGNVEALDGWLPIRRTLGALAFGVNGWIADAGEQVIEDHREEPRHQELYVVLRGRARFRSDAEEFDVQAGSLAFYDDGDIRRGAVALEDDTLVLAIGGNQGAAYEPAVWEHWYLADAHSERGEHEKAAALLAAALAEHPGHARLHLYLAAAEAQAGRHDEAVANLRRALELDRDDVAHRATAGEAAQALAPLRARADWPL